MELKKLADPKVLVGLAIVVVAIRLLAPNTLAGLLSLAILAACPLGMVLMMKAMGGMGGQKEERVDGPASGDAARERELDELRAEREALHRERTARAQPVERPDVGDTESTGPAP